MKITRPTLSDTARLASWLAALLMMAGAVAAAADAAAPVVPLPAEMAKELEGLGKGVIGKALPAPELADPHEYLALGPGTWEYEIVEGGKDGKKVRTERYEEAKDADGHEVWKRTIGIEFVEYFRKDKESTWGKHLEDDLELGYTSRFRPGIDVVAHMKPGVTRTTESKIEAFKTDKPEHISYTGKLTAKLLYVGQYEVKTPAGTFPAVLVRTEFDIEVGPAKVTDTMYAFFSKGVGKVAELEATRISALLIYHSNSEVAKLLTKYPQR